MKDLIKKWFSFGKKEDFVFTRKDVALGEDDFRIQMNILFEIDTLECRMNLPHRTFTAGIENDYPDSEDDSIMHTLEIWNHGYISIDGHSITGVISNQEARRLFEVAERLYWKKERDQKNLKSASLISRI